MLIANKKVLCEVPPEAPRAMGLSLGAEANQKLVKLKVLVGNVDELSNCRGDGDIQVRPDAFVFIRQPSVAWVKQWRVDLEGKDGMLVALSDIIAMEHPPWCKAPPWVADYSFSVTGGGGASGSAGGMGTACAHEQQGGAGGAAG